ncbi:sensor histidine kinase [Phenylobacterium sp.]|uniref:sensor histidine kinase n=1 Tax=Phenylobacterium sp. TaxID=1871053 RepID=UPI002FC5BCF5
MAGFEVDTKLFRELGELLVGRDSTALVELVKNSYDADATKVEIYGVGLADEGGEIVVSDDGTGMNDAEFSKGFLTIAGRSKTDGERRSPWFERRYTGEKGVGRLAAHKLARMLEVASRRWGGTPRDPLSGFAAIGGVDAIIDWDAVEAHPTLASVDGTGAVVVESVGNAVGTAGTSLRLHNLRRRWTPRDLARFHGEVATLTPPDLLVEALPPTVVRKPVLFGSPFVRDARKPGAFQVVLGGELARPDDLLPTLAESAMFVVEIDCNPDEDRLEIVVTPTRKCMTEYANAEGFRVCRKFPKDKPRVGFQARILQRMSESWPAAYRGVRVYHEGFRVLPYGEPQDDWLELDKDYKARGHTPLARLRNYSDWNLPEGDTKESLVIQGNEMLLGGVFLTRERSPGMEMLVNREGFLPGPEVDFIAEVVRLAIDIQTRVRYAATSEAKSARHRTQERQTAAAGRAGAGSPPTAFLMSSLQGDALTSLREARGALAQGRNADVAASLARVEQQIGAAAELSDEAASEATTYRLLASMGLEHAAFVHEVHSLALTAQTILVTLERLAKTAPADVAQRLQVLIGEARDMRERLRRNSVYLADMTGVEGRRRRTRHAIRERFDVVSRFFERAAATRKVTVENDIPERLLSPPMFPAETAAVLSNLLSNAIKFAGEGGRIRATGALEDQHVVVRIENTGAEVDLATSERWFAPFRSTTEDVDDRLGQGMGLGLTITRSLLDEYGGEIAFVPPAAGFATALQFKVPAR